MANYRFTSDIKSDILFRAGEPTDTTSDFDAEALRYINRAYQAIYMGNSEFIPGASEDWYWLLKFPPATLLLLPFYNTGSVSVTNNAIAFTFSSAPSISLQNYYLKTDDSSDIFRISSHTAGSANATLDDVYTAKNNTAVNFKAMKFEYTIASDILRIVSPMRVYRDNQTKIDGMSLTELERRWPLRLVYSGVPKAFAQLNETTVRFSHYGETTAADYVRVEYDYLQRPADLVNSTNEEPLIPQQYRKTLADLALYFLLFEKDDNRSESIGAMAKQGISAMVRENRHRWTSWGRDMGRIMTRQADLPDNWQPLRTEQGFIIG